ncbi:hypothetical protein ACVW00_000966 [Marmoricola sp. URHA0025 HA25]
MWRALARMTLACGVLAATAAGCGAAKDDGDASPATGRTTPASGASYAARVNELCSDLLVKVKEVNGGGGGHPGHFPLEEYLAEQPKLAALTTAFDAKVVAIPVAAADRDAADALHAFQVMSDRATAMLDAAAATGEQAKFDEAFGAVHRMFDESSVSVDLMTQGIVCNGR